MLGVFMSKKVDATDFAEIGRINHAGKKITIGFDEVGGIVASEGSKDDANKINTPEGTAFTLSEFLKKEYALRKVFSKDVAEAHRRGEIKLQKLGFIDRPYCSGQSLEYIKKYGLNNTQVED